MCQAAAQGPPAAPGAFRDRTDLVKGSIPTDEEIDLLLQDDHAIKRLVKCLVDRRFNENECDSRLRRPHGKRFPPSFLLRPPCSGGAFGPRTARGKGGVTGFGRALVIRSSVSGAGKDLAVGRGFFLIERKIKTKLFPLTEERKGNFKDVFERIQ